MVGNKCIMTSGVSIEALEGRALMSASPLHAIAGGGHNVSSAATTVKKTAALKATLPAVTVDPAVTDPSITYTNFASDPLFSSAGPSPNDIYQGYLGDCYFLATLSSIAKVDPKLIRNDIINNGDGTFTVDFLSGKTQDPIRVNADLPTWPDGQLAYAGFGAGQSLWVAVMEKAFAKFRTGANSYSSIESGWMTEVFSDLGVRSQSYFWASTAVVKLISTQIKTKYAATFATNDTIQDGAPLIADHAYEIDSVQVDKKGVPITIRLRNPWGVDGAGNDGSDDGYVTITLKQGLDNFGGVTTARA